MKRSLFGAMFVVIAFNTAMAQQPEVSIVIKPMVTSLRGNDAVKENFNPAFNFSTGVSISYPIGQSSFINAGVQYAKKGGQNEERVVMNGPTGVIFDGSIKYRLNFHYIAIPIEYRLRVGEKIKGEFGLGIYGAVLMNAQSKAKLSDGTKEKSDETDAFKKADAGISASAKVILPIAQKTFVAIGLNNQFGLLDVSDRPIADDGTIKHNALGLLVELGFKF